jgi:hypothetical protein
LEPTNKATSYSIRLSRSRIKSFTREQPTTLNESPRLERLPFTQTATWITAQDLYDYLGIGVATQSDADYLTICAAASSQFCWRRRVESGYVDSLTTVPSQDVKLGTIMYGSAMYRARGSVETFASFQDMGVSPVTGLNGIIRQLLGIDRPQVA